MSLSLIDDAINKLQVSEARFDLRISTSWDGFQQLVLGNQTSPAPANPTDSDDPIEKLVFQNFGETFDSSAHRFQINAEAIRREVRETIQAWLWDFISENYVPRTKKKFVDTDMGKWYRLYACNSNKNTNLALMDKMVVLYKYLVVNTALPDKEKHVNNGLAIMETLFGKYFKPDEIRQRRRRRRR